MPIELQVINASEFIRLTARARLDFDASVKALQALADACQKRGLNRALLDLRSLPVPPKPLFTTKELAALVSTFRRAGFSQKERLAILYSSDIYGGVRNFAFLSRMGGLQVQAFTEFEAALLWLSEEVESRAERQGEVAVTITKPLSEVKRAGASSAGRGVGVKPLHGVTRRSASGI
jgi:hypothetical protein